MQPEKLKRLKKIYADLIQELDGVSEKEVLSLYEDATVSLVFCDFLALVMDFRKALHGEGYKDLELFYKLETALQRAEKLHPGFAEGPYEALGFLSEEHGEVTKAITKGEGKQRMQEELIDLIVVAWRMLRDEHERADSCIRYGRRGLSGKCPGFEPRDHRSDFEDAAEFEARASLWLVHNGCPNFDPPCAYTQSKPYPYMSWKETGGECPHIPHKDGYCNRWCKLMTARLVVEKEMEDE